MKFLCVHYHLHSHPFFWFIQGHAFVIIPQNPPQNFICFYLKIFDILNHNCELAMNQKWEKVIPLFARFYPLSKRVRKQNKNLFFKCLEVVNDTSYPTLIKMWKDEKPNNNFIFVWKLHKNKFLVTFFSLCDIIIHRKFNGWKEKIQMI